MSNFQEPWALVADLHLDSRRSNLQGNKINPETGLDSFCEMRLRAFEEYLSLLETDKLLILGDLFNNTANERIKQLVFQLIRKHLKRCILLLGNHEVSRFYHAFSSIHGIFDMKDVDFQIIDKPTIVNLFEDVQAYLVPWEYRMQLNSEKDMKLVMCHSDPKEVNIHADKHYIFGHIHANKAKKRYTQLGVMFPNIYGEQSRGTDVYLTTDGKIAEKEIPLLFDIVDVVEQENIDDNDPKRVCYRIRCDVIDNIKIPKEAIYYVYYPLADNAIEMDSGEWDSVNGSIAAINSIRKDAKLWIENNKVPKLLRKKVYKRIVKTVTRGTI